MIDTRCCGSGTCMINADGTCWCGQVWNGVHMVSPHYINEAGLRVDAVTGNLVQSAYPAAQCLPP
jgi:hypothetical protein